MPLTRHRSAITILTEDMANSWYGGLYGTTEGAILDADDPLNVGHAHDGLHLDGHAQKINLSTHVTGELDGSDILDASISASKLDFSAGSGAVGLILLTVDGRIIVDTDGDILLKENE